MTTQNLKDLAAGFGVTPFAAALEADPWRKICVKPS